MSEPVNQNQEGLSLTDLKNLLAIVDYAASQGAFKGWDTIKQVVGVRDKLAAFIVSAEPKQEEEGPELQMHDEPVSHEAPTQEETSKKGRRRKKAD